MDETTPRPKPRTLSHQERHPVIPELFRVRLATADDADDILAVYAPFVDTPVTFEEEVPVADAFRARVEDVLDRYPYLVAERDDRVVGYAYAHAQAERAAYAWNVELSVYLAPAAQGVGLGAALYNALIELVRMQGMKCAYARITLPNAASERLHHTFGFQLMGVQKNAGYTCGAWRDVAWLTLPLAAFDPAPKPPVAFPTLVRDAGAAVDGILAHASAVLRSPRCGGGVAAAEDASEDGRS